MLTITETNRRLKQAAAECRAIRGMKQNWRVEVGTRAIPVYGKTITEAIDENERVQQYDPENPSDTDDLYEFHNLYWAARDEQVRGEGYVAHLYWSSTGQYGELEDVITVWLGPDRPIIIH